jgi:hypothetical protein
VLEVKAIYTVTSLLLLSSQLAFASVFGAQYFNGKNFEEIKPLQMIGAIKTAQDLERENQVSRVVEANRRTLAYCYERELNNGPLTNLEAIFYFTVAVDGKFNNVTADVISPIDVIKNSLRLVSCASQIFYSFKAAAFPADRTFRYRVLFSQKQ